jgi:hypothetical protein
MCECVFGEKRIPLFMFMMPLLYIYIYRHVTGIVEEIVKK